MATERVSLARLWALMATVFVDMMGFLMVMPVLPFYADRLGASPFIIGLMVSAFALAQLLVAPYWGKLSDRRGRRPTLMLGIGIATVASPVTRATPITSVQRTPRTSDTIALTVPPPA